MSCVEPSWTHQDSGYIVGEYFGQDGKWCSHGSGEPNCIHRANDEAENDELRPSLGSVQQATTQTQTDAAVNIQCCGGKAAAPNPNTQLINYY